MNSKKFATGKYDSWCGTVTTQVLDARDDGTIQSAAAAVECGELIILPTDTVYGVGTNAFDERSIRHLFTSKQRDRDRGIPVLIADTADLGKIATDIPQMAEKLIALFWPGPLTLVLPKGPGLPPNLSLTDSVAVRMPDHKLCREIIRAAGGALAATSANLSGRAPAVQVSQALYDLAGSVSIAVDDGPSGGQMASTVVDVTGESPRILRQGPLSIADLMQGVRP
jgi:L-threonylcarbamoyladenylate synthase